MTFNYDTEKIIILFFPAYAGGKFLTNCLALSKHATFQHADIALEDLRLKDSNFENYYEWKLQTALKSLPDTPEKIKNWRQNEIYGCEQLFNWDAKYEKFEENSLSVAVKVLSSRNDTDFFVIAHDIQSLNNILNHFPNAKILFLKNYLHFMEISYKIKQPNGFNIDYKKDKHFLSTISHCSKVAKSHRYDYQINLKNIFNEELFIKELKNLYEKLGYNDFQENIIKIFYKKYIDLHAN